MLNAERGIYTQIPAAEASGVIHFNIPHYEFRISLLHSGSGLPRVSGPNQMITNPSRYTALAAEQATG